MCQAPDRGFKVFSKYGQYLHRKMPDLKAMCLSIPLFLLLTCIDTFCDEKERQSTEETETNSNNSKYEAALR